MTINWKDPVPITLGTMPSFPTHIFPDWTKDYMEGLSKELNTQIDLPATAVLSVFSVLLMKKYQFRYENLNWVLNLNIYQLLGSDPGSKKDAVINRIFKVLLDYQKNLIDKAISQEPELLSELDMKKSQYEELISSKSSLGKNSSPKNEELKKLKEDIMRIESELNKSFFIISGDVTQEKITELLKRNEETLTIATSEASEMFDHLEGRYKADSIDIYLKAWEGTNYSKLRSSTNDIYLEHPLLNLCLFTQPQEITRLRKHDGRGLLQRFLVVVPDRYPKEKISLENTMYPSLADTFDKNIKKLFELNVENTARTVTVDPNAWNNFNNLYKEILYESYEDVSYTTQQWLMKIFGNVIKVICLIKIVEEVIGNNRLDNIALNDKDIAKAHTLYKYYYTHFRRVAETDYYSVKEADLQFFFRRLLEINKDHHLNGKISSTEINNYIKRINRADREVMLEKLEDHHLIKVIKNGRRKTVYINPEIIKKPHKEALNFVRITKNSI